MASDKTFRSYRLSAESIRKLDELAERFTLDKTTCLEAGIAFLYQALDKPSKRKAEAIMVEAKKNP